MDRNRTIGIEDIVAAAQLRRVGESAQGLSRRVQLGRLHRVWRGCYVQRDLWDALTPERRAIARHVAFSLVTKAEVTFSHTSAALLHGMGLYRVPERLHLSGWPRPSWSHPLITGHALHDVATDRVLTTDRLSTTSMARTALDCARTLPELDAVVLLDQFLARGVSRSQLEELIRAEPRAHGNAKALHRLELADACAESVAETVARCRIRERGLPMPRSQVVIPTALGKCRVDFEWEDLMLVLEVDGGLKYSDYGPASDVIVRERQREKAIQNTGRLVLRATWRDLHDGREEFLRRLGDAILPRQLQRGIPPWRVTR